MTAAGMRRPPRIPKTPAPVVVDSPRVRRLAVDLAEGHADAVERFWAEARAAGTPLVEPDTAGDPALRTVTFLWRRAGDEDQVVLMANKLTDPSVWDQSVLEPLAGTDVLWRAYRLRADWRASYQLAASSAAERDAEAARTATQGGPALRWRGLAAHAGPDPLNRRQRLPGKAGAADLSVVELPDAPPQPWTAHRPDVAHGSLQEHRVEARALGDPARRVWVYVPPEGSASRPESDGLDVLVLLDGEDWAGRLRGRDLLDNLIADGRIRPTLVLMLDAVDTPTRWRELGARGPIVDFLADGLLPWAAGRWPITRDPARTTVAGHSLGGVTAAWAALVAPGRFGAAIAQSPSLWWTPEEATAPDVGVAVDEGADRRGWLADSFAQLVGQAPDLRLRLTVGREEWVLLEPCRQLLRQLMALGVDVRLSEYNGGHDVLCWRGELAEALIALGSSPPTLAG